MSFSRLVCVALFAAGCHAAVQFPPTVARPAGKRVTVASDRGPLVGIERADLRVFLGVPYAAPPTGEQRWRPPAPPVAWAGPRDATRTGHLCPQLVGGRLNPDSDEDCLNLNLWAPPDAHGLPVLVWIHGGGFYTGSGAYDLYDGARLATRAHAVVVTINYRLGALGFLGHRDIAREMGRPAAPSLGILDQRAALAWAQRNIAGFGGDPNNVTIFGESAGAWSTCVHLVSPASRGLFARAIIQSGSCSEPLYFTPEQAEAQGDALAAKVGCRGNDALACLRQKSVVELVSALPYRRGMLLQPGVWWGPTVDGVELPRVPLVMMRAGDFARVPLLIGATRDEGILHTMSYDQVTPDELSWFVRDALGDAAASVFADQYRRPTPKAALTDVVTDGIFVCGARRVAHTLAAASVPVFLYTFVHPLDDPRVHDLGATHSIDEFFVFGNRSMGYGITPREQPLADTMMDAWGAFARGGDPSTPSLPWPRYDAADEQHMTLDVRSTVGRHLKQDICDFWDSVDRTR
jgi:para-nitrobenzyl esterase